MLFSILFAVPLWITVPAYFALGILWAVLYLPHAVARQLRRYTAWKAEVLDGRTLEQAMSLPYRHSNHPLTPNQFLLWRGEDKFTERALLKGFIFDVAFWPLRILKLVVIDVLRFVMEKLGEYLADFWRLVVAPVFRWVGRVLREFWHEFIVPLCKQISRFLRFLWLNLIVEALRGLRRFARYAWQEVIAPAYRWVYDRVVRVYQTIIIRANREAIADLEILNRAPKEEK